MTPLQERLFAMQDKSTKQRHEKEVELHGR